MAQRALREPMYGIAIRGKFLKKWTVVLGVAFALLGGLTKSAFFLYEHVYAPLQEEWTAVRQTQAVTLSKVASLEKQVERVEDTQKIMLKALLRKGSR